MHIRDIAIGLGLAVCFAVASPTAHAFSISPGGDSGVSGGAALVDPDDRLKSMFGERDENGAANSGAAAPFLRFGRRPAFTPGFGPAATPFDGLSTHGPRFGR